MLKVSYVIRRGLAFFALARRSARDTLFWRPHVLALPELLSSLTIGPMHQFQTSTSNRNTSTPLSALWPSSPCAIKPHPHHLLDPICEPWYKNTMQYVLNALTTWSKLNKIKINPLKTKAIIFCAKNKKVKSRQMIYIDDQPVEIVKVHKVHLPSKQGEPYRQSL